MRVLLGCLLGLAIGAAVIYAVTMLADFIVRFV